MFKFKDYPNLHNLHNEYKKLVDSLYSLEFKIEKKGENVKLKEKYNDLHSQCKNFENITYEKAIFNIFASIKPKILNRRTNTYEQWDIIFGSEFDSIPSENKGCLVCAVEESGGIYRLSPEYYE